MTGVRDVLVSSDGAGVRRITLNRPEKRNALTREMFETLIGAFTVEPAPADRVTVVAARGPVYCAGVDLGQRTEGGDAEGESPLERLCAAVRRYPLPVLAVVQGAAVGGGAMFALHCDFVLAATTARIGNTAVQLGLVPAWPVARRILELAGPATAARLLLLGDLIAAPQLAAGNVIMEAVDPAALDARAVAVTARLARNAPLSLRAIKATLNAEGAPAADHGRVTELIVRAQRSEDAREGVRARREKREPNYTGG